jgi:GntR family transcriptional repressor for pyruvate dehydrogenase complex
VSFTSGNEGRPNLRKRVIERLEHSIKMGGYRTDEKLPTEHELAAEFQVSRPIIRDVLQVLRNKGLIYSRQGSGSYVKSNGYKPPLSFAPVTTRSDFQQFYQFRLAIEPTAAAVAASKMTESDIIQLSLPLSDMRSPRLPERGRLDAEFQFHANIAKASGNSFFATVIDALHTHMLADSRPHPTQQGAIDRQSDAVFEEHAKIYEALRTRNALDTHDAMKSHLTNALARFEGSITL